MFEEISGVFLNNCRVLIRGSSFQQGIEARVVNRIMMSYPKRRQFISCEYELLDELGEFVCRYNAELQLKVIWILPQLFSTHTYLVIIRDRRQDNSSLFLLRFTIIYKYRVVLKWRDRIHNSTVTNGVVVLPDGWSLYYYKGDIS